MAENSTRPTGASVEAFLDSVEPPVRRADGHRFDAVFREVTGWKPRLWGSSIIGHGRYAYRYESGRTGEFLATGFSPRRAALSIYIMPGYQDYGDILDRLGPHRMGKSCLYVTRLDRVDEEVLAELVGRGLEDLSRIWPVSAE